MADLSLCRTPIGADPCAIAVRMGRLCRFCAPECSRDGCTGLADPLILECAEHRPPDPVATPHPTPEEYPRKPPPRTPKPPPDPRAPIIGPPFRSTMYGILCCACAEPIHRDDYIRTVTISGERSFAHDGCDPRPQAVENERREALKHRPTGE